MKLSSLSAKRSSHMILFGDPKSGKSTLASKLLLAGFRLTWISMDNGHEVLFKLPMTMEQLDENLNLVIIPDTREVPAAITTCLKISTGAACLICDTHGIENCPGCKAKKDAVTWTRVCCNEFESKDIIVYDHLGQLTTSSMGATFKKLGAPDNDKPERDHYGMQWILLEKFLTNIQQARYNVICITHVDEVEQEDKSKKLVPVCGTRNFSRTVGKYFDHMVYCHVGGAKHKFGSGTGYQNNLITGSRTDVFIEKMTEPSLVPFFDGTIRPESEEKPSDAKAVLSNLTEKLLVTEKSAAKSEPVVSTLVTEPVAQPVASTTEAPKATSPAFDRAKLLASLKQNRS